MSRTQRHERDPSFEYWSARPGNRHGRQADAAKRFRGCPCCSFPRPGARTKRMTHKAERRANLEVDQGELEELEGPETEI